jgi:hypothetical protein
MDEEEYRKKYTNLKILKSVQDYLKSDTGSSGSVFPVKIPDELFLQILRLDGPEGLDYIVHQIFKLGLTLWNEKLFDKEFGSPAALAEFIDLMKRRSEADK